MTAARRRPDLRRASAVASADRWVGVEHEFETRRHDAPVDFRRHVTGLAVGRPHFDPGDPCARRLEWGGVITADGREAEIATPPRTAGPGSATTLELDTRWATAELRAALGATAPGVELTGYSTHVSVECDDRQAVRTARRVVDTFGAPLMLLLDRSTSPGLLVRPRRGRVEIGGDYVAGSQLRAATTFATAAVTWVATTDRRTWRRARRQLAVPGRIEPAVGRFGYYIDRAAYGVDLYVGGRATPLPTGRTAGEHLSVAWATVRPTARLLSDDEEIAVVDDIVDGRRPLPLESAERARPPGAWPPEPSPFGDAMRTRVRGDLRLSPRLVTWDLVVLEVENLRQRGAGVLVATAGRDASAFLDDVDRGAYDRPIVRALSRAGRHGTLASVESVRGPSVHDRLGPGDRLVRAERNPSTGRIGGGGRRSRLDKHDAATSPGPSPSRPSPAPPPGTRWRLFVGVGFALAVVAVVAGWAIGTGRGDDDAGRPAAAPVGTADVAPSTTSSTAPATTTASPTTVARTPIAAALDPALIDGYVMFSRIVTAEVAPGLPEPLIPQPGDTGFSEVLIDCTNGRCALDASDLQFAAAAPTIVAEFTMQPQPGDQCDFTRTFALEARRADDGRYSGTLITEILPLFSEGPAGPCWGQRSTEELVLVPITD